MKTVLVVDDSSFFRKILKDALEAMHCQVIGEGANGHDGVNHFLALNPDITLLDITMPELDGLSALRRIKEKSPSAVVIMISALGQEQIINEALTLGAHGFIIKPDVTGKLKEIIAAL